MTRYGRRLRFLAAAMAAQAGYVDALGFVELRGYFVSFMSGNSTRMAVELTRNAAGAETAGALVLLFVVGVAAGTAVRRVARRRPIAVVQACVALLLFVAALAHAGSLDRIAIALMAIAMGAENAAFERDGEVAIGVTYVTGALVKTGQHLVTALTGGDRTAWLWQAMLWLGLVAGAALGALAHARWGLSALWWVTAVAAGLALTAARIEPTQR